MAESIGSECPPEGADPRRWDGDEDSVGAGAGAGAGVWCGARWLGSVTPGPFGARLSAWPGARPVTFCRPARGPTGGPTVGPAGVRLSAWLGPDCRPGRGPTVGLAGGPAVAGSWRAGPAARRRFGAVPFPTSRDPRLPRPVRSSGVPIRIVYPGRSTDKQVARVAGAVRGVRGGPQEAVRGGGELRGRLRRHAGRTEMQSIATARSKAAVTTRRRPDGGPTATR